MSSNVDNRVVQMTFDNKQFEKNAHATLETLKELKDSLKFEQTAKEMDRLQNAANALKFDSIEKNLQRLADFTTIPGRMFSKLFDDIASKAVETGEKLVRALEIEPRIDGFREYENKIQSIQVIAANTGVLMRDMEDAMGGTADSVWKAYDWTASEIQAASDIWEKGTYGNGADRIDALTEAGYDYYRVQSKVNDMLYQFSNEGEDCNLTIEDIEAGLDELNKYADDTIYNFSQMTQAIGTFTTAGVDFNTSVSDVKGIANLAALVGAPASDASRAMFQLSQGLASGTIRLQDWMSIERTAGMGGKIFQEALKETARVHGIAIDDIIEANGSFRESLREDWLTADVLNETLAKFSGEMTREEWAALGYSEEQIDYIERLAAVATDAATKVRTWTQLVDSSKEALGSTWSKTWEILIGDFYEAPKLLTRMANAFASVVEPIGNARNRILEMWAAIGGREYLIEAFANLFHVVKNIVTAVGEVIYTVFGRPSEYNIARFLKTITKAFYDFTAMLRYGTEALPAFKNVLTTVFTIGSVVVDIFKAAWNTLKDVVVEVISWFYHGENVIGSLGDALSTATEFVLGYVLAFKDWIEESKLFEKAHDGIISAVKKVPDAFNKATKAVTSFFKAIKDAFLKGIKWIEDRTGVNLIEVVKGIGMAISGIIFMIFDAIANLNFKALIPGLLAIPELLLDGIIKIKDFFSSLIHGSKEATEAVDEAGNVIAKKKDAFSEFFGSLSSVLAPFNKESGIFAKIWAGITGIFETLEAYGLPGIFSVLASGSVIAAMMKIKDVFDALEETVSKFKKLSGGVLGVLRGVKDVLRAYAMEIRAKALLTVAIAAAVLAASIWALSQLPSEKVEIAAVAISTVMGVLMGCVKWTTSIGKLIGLSLALIAMSTAIADLTLVGLILSFVPAEKIKNGITAMGEVIMIFVGAMWLLGKAIGSLKMTQLIGAAFAIVALAAAINLLIIPLIALSFIPEDKLSKGMKALGKVMFGLVLALAGVAAVLLIFSNLMSRTATTLSDAIALSTVFITFAGAIMILTLAVMALSLIKPANLAKGILALTVIIAVGVVALAAITAALYVFFKVIRDVQPRQFKALTPVLLALSLVIMTFVGALLMLSIVPFKMLMKSVIALVVMLLAMAGAFRIMNGVTMDAKKILTVMLAFSITVGILAAALVKLGTINETKLTLGLIALVAVIAALVGSLYFIVKITNDIKAKKLATLAQAMGVFAIQLLALAVVILAIKDAVKAFKDVGPGDLIAMLLMLAVILGSFVASVFIVSKFGTSAVKPLKALALALAGFAAVIYSMGFVLKWMTKFIQVLMKLNNTDMSGLTIALGQTLDAIVDNMDRIKYLVQDAAEFVGYLIGAILQRHILTLIGIIKSAAKPMVDAIIFVLKIIKDNAREITKLIGEIVAEIILGLADASKDLIDAMAELAIDILVNLLESLGTKMSERKEDITVAFYEFIAGLWDLLCELLLGWLLGPNAAEKISNAISKAAKWLWDAVTWPIRTVFHIKDIFMDILGDIKVAWHNIVKWFKEKIANFKETKVGQAISTAFDFIADLGKIIVDAWQTMIDGIKKLYQELKDTLNGVGDFCKGYFGDFWDNWKTGMGIGSPSKISTQYGAWVGEGLFNGIESQKDKILSGVDNLTGKIRDEFDEKKAGLFDSKGLTDQLQASLGSGFSLGSIGIDQGSAFDGISNVLDAQSIGVNVDTLNMGVDDLDMDTSYTRDISSNVSSMSDDSSNRIVDSIKSLTNQMTAMAEEIKRLKVQLDTGALVGELVDPMDEALGSRAASRSRGV